MTEEVAARKTMSGIWIENRVLAGPGRVIYRPFGERPKTYISGGNLDETF